MIVGSYNWTNAGAYDNDENTLILHDRELARACYAEWQWLWGMVPVGRVCNWFEIYLPVVLGHHTRREIPERKAPGWART